MSGKNLVTRSYILNRVAVLKINTNIIIIIMNNIINLKILNNYKVHTNNQISDITLILEHLSKLTGEHVDMLVSMIYKYDGYSLSTLKVNILKDIIKYLKVDLGYYNLSTSLNKPALVQSIELILLPLLASSLTSSSTAAVAASETSSLSVSSSSSSSLTTTIATISKKSAAMALASTSKSNIIKSPSCMRSSSLPLSLPSPFINGTHTDAIPHKSSSNSSSSSNNNNNNNKNKNNNSNFQDSTYHSNDMKTTSHAHTAPSTTTALTSTNKSQQIKKKNIQIYPSIVDTIEKRNIYDELMNYPGITSQEIIEEFECLLNINNSDSSSSSSSSSSDYDNKVLDADLILMNIISKRQLAEELLASAAFDISSQQYDLLVEQENKDYDDAVRESEKERDVIAVRDVMFIYVLF